MVVVELAMNCSICLDVLAVTQEPGVIEAEAKYSTDLMEMVEPVEEKIVLAVWWKNEMVSLVEALVEAQAVVVQRPVLSRNYA